MSPKHSGQSDKYQAGTDGAGCECVACHACGGTGSVWFDIAGRYIGNHRCTDLDNLDTCDDCGGSGVSERCAECAEKEFDHDNY